MPDMIRCPECQYPVSRHAIECRMCGKEINDVPNGVTAELILSLHDDDLADFLYYYASHVLEDVRPSARSEDRLEH